VKKIFKNQKRGGVPTSRRNNSEKDTPCKGKSEGIQCRYRGKETSSANWPGQNGDRLWEGMLRREVEKEHAHSNTNRIQFEVIKPRSAVKCSKNWRKFKECESRELKEKGTGRAKKAGCLFHAREKTGRWGKNKIRR